jgi:hypothetical protein
VGLPVSYSSNQLGLMNKGLVQAPELKRNRQHPDRIPDFVISPMCWNSQTD